MKTLLLFSRPMRDKDTSALREIFNIPHHCDPHLNQTKLNDLLPLTIDGVLSGVSYESYVGVSSLLSIFLITVATFHLDLFFFLWILKDNLFGQLTNSYLKSLSFLIHCHPPAHGLKNHNVSIMLIIKLRRNWRPVPCHRTLSSLCLRHHR